VTYGRSDGQTDGQAEKIKVVQNLILNQICFYDPSIKF